MAKGCLQIDLLGASFAIQADEKPEYLNALYNHYKKTVNQIESTSGLGEPLKVKEKMKHPEQNNPLDLVEAEKLALAMISRIEQAIN